MGLVFVRRYQLSCKLAAGSTGRQAVEGACTVCSKDPTYPFLLDKVTALLPGYRSRGSETLGLFAIVPTPISFPRCIFKAF